ncbi:uncharacterized protein MELLADRAFT_56009 [Melampsora larici-populina 98AG31]|uniref:Uncharacterized protein n=1 Tax=Melampsora larici-populina (strain 98AG31 / pathotype 3-4-7) TaxID=747676 RepID=F4RKN0_MELLP|nr:uncharacterized protein MELLADRAFT_56009 [Melampsora larici-populina 98AG31]EGG07122.1 hypothetical protein MELLADRAFT_56009 [Melampsora larici-populina 98AG31]
MVGGAWAETTLQGYSSAVAKFKEYIEDQNKDWTKAIPVKAIDIYGWLVFELGNWQPNSPPLS